MSTDSRPWVPTTLAPSKRKQAVSDELRAGFREVWEENPEDFRDKQTSTDSNDAVNGSVAFDKFDVAKLLSNHIKRAHPDWQSASLKPSEIARRISWAADDAGVSRTAIIAKKAAHLAIQESTGNGSNGNGGPVAEQPEPLSV